MISTAMDLVSGSEEWQSTRFPAQALVQSDRLASSWLCDAGPSLNLSVRWKKCWVSLLGSRKKEIKCRT